MDPAVSLGQAAASDPLVRAVSRACVSRARARRRAQPGVFVNATYGRHGSPRSPGHGGSGVGTDTLGTTGSTSRDGMLPPEAMVTSVVALGRVCENAQIGCAPLGAAIVTLIRDPARYAWPS